MDVDPADRAQDLRTRWPSRHRHGGRGSTSRSALPSPNRSASSGHRPLPDQPTGGEDADPVADRLDLVEEVARQQDRHPAFLGRDSQQVEDLRDAEGVDRRRRLVEDEDVRILDQRVGDAEPLEHAPRVRARSGRRRGRSGRPARAPRRSSSSGLVARDPVEPRRVAQVLAAGHVAVEPDGVGQIADPTLDLERPTRRIEPDDACRPSVGSVSPRSMRIVVVLPAPFWPEQAEDLAGPDLEVEMVDRDEVAVFLRQASCLDRGRGGAARCWTGARRGGSLSVRPAPGSLLGRDPSRTARSSPTVGPEDVEQAAQDQRDQRDADERPDRARSRR